MQCGSVNDVFKIHAVKWSHKDVRFRERGRGAARGRVVAPRDPGQREVLPGFPDAILFVLRAPMDTARLRCSL